MPESEEPMLEFLPEDIRRSLLLAQETPGRRRHRLSVHVGDAVFPLLRLWDDGFAVNSARAPKLRGLIDLFDGPRHISQCLIVAAEADGDVVFYEFKRVTTARDEAARDYAADHADAGHPPARMLPGPA